MPRYINADALKKEIELLKVYVVFARQSGKDVLNGTLLEYRKAVLKIIDEQPPADVVPKSEVAKSIEKQQEIYNETIARLRRMGKHTHFDVIVALAEEIDHYRDKIRSIEEFITKHEGKWVPSDYPDEKYVCSVCGGACWYYDSEGEVAKSRYCPNCGAKMKGGAE